jgi:hypothetical protein
VWKKRQGRKKPADGVREGAALGSCATSSSEGERGGSNRANEIKTMRHTKDRQRLGEYFSKELNNMLGNVQILK